MRGKSEKAESWWRDRSKLLLRLLEHKDMGDFKHDSHDLLHQNTDLINRTQVALGLHLPCFHVPASRSTSNDHYTDNHIKFSTLSLNKPKPRPRKNSS